MKGSQKLAERVSARAGPLNTYLKRKGRERRRERDREKKAIHMLVIFKKYKISKVVVLTYYAAKTLIYSIQEDCPRAPQSAVKLLHDAIYGVNVALRGTGKSLQTSCSRCPPEGR